MRLIFHAQFDPFKDIYQALSLPLMSSFISFALVKKFTDREREKKKFSHASEVDYDQVQNDGISSVDVYEVISS